jgi:signal transduction histidine kinase
MVVAVKYRPFGFEQRGASKSSFSRTPWGLVDEERHRLARELHDESGQIFSSTLLKLDVYLAGLSPNSALAAKALHDVREALVVAIRDLHSLVYRLYPPMLAEWGLPATLQWLVQQFAAQQGIAAVFDGPTECRLSPALEIAVFRIVQEALTNVAKHSRARNVSVQLTVDAEQAIASIVDDGQGFDQDRIRARSTPSFGLVGIRERASGFDGDVVITSEPGQGTTVRATLQRSAIHHGNNSCAAGRRSSHSATRFAGTPRRRERHRDRR